MNIMIGDDMNYIMNFETDAKYASSSSSLPPSPTITKGNRKNEEKKEEIEQPS